MSKPYTNSSALSSRATFKRRAAERDAAGNIVWETVGVCWASAQDRPGGEFLLGAQNKRISTAKTTFTVRSTELTRSITPAMRIEWRGFDFNILSGPIFTDDRNFVQFEGEREF